MERDRIWIVTELFYPEETAVAFIFSRIANFLTKNYRVGVICGPKFYDNKKINFIDATGVSDKIEIFRVKSFNLNKNSLVQRTIKIVLLSFQMGILMCKKISRGETVLLSTNPALLLLFVRIIRHYKKIQLHILVHDVFPENAIPAKILKRSNSVLFKWLKYLFDKAYSDADHLIVIGRDMEEVIFGKTNRFKFHPVISVVPNWSNPDKIPVNSKIINIDEDITLLYAGNIGRVQGLMEILEAFRKSNTKKLKLRFRGTGALYDFVKNYIRNYHLDNVTISGAYSRDDEGEIYSGCDIGIVSLSKGMFGLGVPSKSYQLLSSGKPILFIGEPDSEISNMVLDNNIGWSLNVSNENDLINFFNNLDSIDRSSLRSMGKKSRLLAETAYNETVILKLLQSRIELVEYNKFPHV